MFKIILFPLVLLSLIFGVGCTTDNRGDACGVPIVLEMLDANTGEAVADAKIVAKNRDYYPDDTSAIEWDASKNIYWIAGSSGTYSVRIQHSEYPDILLEGIKVEEYDGGDGGSMTQTIVLEARKVSDPNPGGAPPYEIKSMVESPPRCR